MARQFGMDGIVVGILDGKGRVDVARTKKLVDLAHPLPVTFHRAFDATRNLSDSLEAVIQTGATRVLTSGGKQRAMDGLPSLARLVEAADERIAIMPGGGIDVRNVVRVIRRTSAREVHTSLGSSSRLSSARYRAAAGLRVNGNHSANHLEVLTKRVRTVKDLLETITRAAD